MFCLSLIDVNRVAKRLQYCVRFDRQGFVLKTRDGNRIENILRYLLCHAKCDAIIRCDNDLANGFDSCDN